MAAASTAAPTPGKAPLPGVGRVYAVKDPKTAVNQFAQRFLGRPVTKADIIYTTTKFPVGAGIYQTIVRFVPLGQEFAGETADNPKAAEQSASEQVLKYYAKEINTMTTVAGGNAGNAGTAAKKRRTSSTPSLLAPQPPLTPGFLGTKPRAILPGWGEVGQVTGSAAAGMPDGAATNSPTASSSLTAPLALVAMPALTPTVATAKSELNCMCSKILRRPMDRTDVEYETSMVPGGFQATVRMRGLPDDWGSQIWAGEICERKADAEQSVAGIALLHLRADPALCAICSAPSKQKSTGKGSYWKGGKSKNSGGGGK
eukprot:TRINITY_DN31178_c0_g1_i1.p1 TRINITY_DN31178_c0_g1~~TRINITY_DN31178_c0_g1_i1.p1  ORF type:complete len:315 (+),score=48.49 TRINITY_DN31178_c0_g1_i1:42-986(+)